MASKQFNNENSARLDKVSEYNLRQSERNINTNTVAFVLRIILFVIILASLISLFTGKSHFPTFSSLLDYFSNSFDAIPSVPFTSFSSTSMDPWIFNTVFGIIDLTWAQAIVSIFLSVVDVLVFFVNGIISIINFVVAFFAWLFL